MAKFKAYKYSIGDEVSTQYAELGRNNSNVLGELNQLMESAVKSGEVGGNPYYDHAKTGVRIHTQKQYRVITKVEALEKPFAQSVTFSQHAIERITERLNQPEFNAENYVRMLLASATYMGTTSNRHGICDNYSHHKSGVTIVVSQADKRVVTVKSRIEQAPATTTISVSRISDAIKREFARMKTELSRQIRKHSEQLARLEIEVATLKLNKVRCKAPHTQELIQSRIDGFMAQVTELAQEIDVKLTQIQTAETEVKAVVGE